MIEFYSMIKGLRIKKGKTLREFCKQYGFNPVLYSKMERGLQLPPKDEKSLRVIANALDIKFGSKEWFNLVSAAKSAKLKKFNILDKLPVLHTQHLSTEQLDVLAKVIGSV